MPAGPDAVTGGLHTHQLHGGVGNVRMEDAKRLPFGEAEPGAVGLSLLLPLSLKWGKEQGLNLCPFANAVLKKERLHIQVSEATEPLALLEDLRTELKRLLAPT